MENLKFFEQPNDLNNYLHQLKWNNNLAVASYFTEVQNDQIISNFAYCFKDPIFKFSLKMFMQNDFILINELNRFIQQAMETELFFKWLKEYQPNVLNNKVEKFQHFKVNVQMFTILFLICGGMLLLAFCIWIIEKIVHKNVRTPNSSTIWRFIEMIIDPDRHFWQYDLSYY